MPYPIYIEGTTLKHLPLFIFTFTVMGSTLNGCAVYPDAPVARAPAERQHDHQDRDDERDDDHQRNRKHDEGHDRERDHEDK